MKDPLKAVTLWLAQEIEYSFAAFWEQVERTADFLREADNAAKLIQEAVGLLVILVGPRGGGKTTAASWWVEDRKESEPDTPIVSNVPITGAIYVPDILKFLATKLAIEGKGGKNYEVLEDNTVLVLPRHSIPAKMLIIIDEAAISGFEARGSGVGSPLHTYLLALSRKLNVDIVLISQLLSMSDKRAQWLADFYWLCEAVPILGSKILDHFRYRIYNENYHKTQEFTLTRQDAFEYLFGKFDTYDIPNYEALAEAFTIQYQITDEDIQFYKDIRDHRQHIPMQPMKENVVSFPMRKALRAPSGRWPGETFLVMGKDGEYHRYEVLQRDWDMVENVYQYRAREIPNNAYIEDSELEEGVAA
jgi:hypothetical protein